MDTTQKKKRDARKHTCIGPCAEEIVRPKKKEEEKDSTDSNREDDLFSRDQSVRNTAFFFFFCQGPITPRVLPHHEEENWGKKTLGKEQG